MSPLARIAQLLLILHGIMNIAQGFYSLASPQEYAQMAGDMFAGVSDKAIMSIGRSQHIHITQPPPYVVTSTTTC